MRPKRFFLRDFVLPEDWVHSVKFNVVEAAPMNEMAGSGAEQELVQAIRTNQFQQEIPRYVLPADDTVKYSARFSCESFDLLREFAAFQDFPQKQYVLWGERAFGEGYDPNGLPSLTAAWNKQRATYPHLVFHEHNRGFYFPTLIKVPIKTDFGFIGSTTQLRQELTQLATKTPKALRFRATVKEAITLLLTAIDHAEQSQLPIIFDG
jgi:hypothetical protein